MTWGGDATGMLAQPVLTSSAPAVTTYQGRATRGSAQRRPSGGKRRASRRGDRRAGSERARSAHDGEPHHPCADSAWARSAARSPSSARIVAEPFIQKAIDYDSGHAAKDALRKGPGSGWRPPGIELFSRGVHRTVGVGVGMILFGVAIGGLGVREGWSVGPGRTRTRATEPRPSRLFARPVGAGVRRPCGHRQDRRPGRSHGRCRGGPVSVSMADRPPDSGKRVGFRRASGRPTRRRSSARAAPPATPRTAPWPYAPPVPTPAFPAPRRPRRPRSR